jgi:hypothetical protein
MQPIVQYRPSDRQTPTEPAATPRPRTVTGNRFPRKCACGCGLGIPRDPEIRYVMDFGSSRPSRAYPAHFREHSLVEGRYAAAHLTIVMHQWNTYVRK